MMGRITAVDRDGDAHELEAEPGLSLMEILRDADLPIEAICGGKCVCSRCHVYIDPEWEQTLPPRREAEQVLVEDTGYFRENSRLGCQVEYTDELDGLKLVLAPEF